MSYSALFPVSGGGLARLAVCAVLLMGCGDSPEAMVESARQYLAKNDLNAASIQLKNALQKDEKLAEARFLLGSVNLEQGDFAGAAKEFRRALTLGIPAARVSPPLAQAMVQQGEFEQVLKEFEGKEIDDSAARAQVLGAIGEAHLARQEIDQAKSAFGAALKANEQDVRARIGFGRAKFASGDKDGAMAEADAALLIASKGRDVAEAHVLRADVLLARKQTSDAIEAMVAALKVQPAAVNYHFGLISLLLQEGNLEVAREKLDAMRKAAPLHPLTRYLQAFVEFRGDNAAAAREHIDETVRLAPKYLPGRLLAGLIHGRLNEHTFAQTHLAAVLSSAPQHALARRALAQSELATGEPQRALETLQPLLDKASPDLETLRLAGQIYVANGNIERAAQVYAKVASAKPDDAKARTQLAISHLLRGDSVQALDELETASKLKSSTGEADLALILAHLRRGELDKAMAAQRKLESKQPDSPQTYVIKANILIAQKDIAGARGALEKAISLKADYFPAAIALSRLDLVEKRPQEATKRFEAIIAANPKNVGAYLLLADLQRTTGATPQVVRATLERASKADGAAVAPKLALVLHDLSQRDTKTALALALEVAAAHPADARVQGVLGRAQLAAGDQQQAVAAFNKQASLRPAAVEPLVELADAQGIAKDVTGAERSLRRALALKPGVLEVQQRLISLLVENKRTEEAIGIARIVQKERPNAAVGWVLEGDINSAMKNWGPAIVAYRKALDGEKNPGIVVKLYAAQKQAGRPADAEKTAGEWLRAEPKDVVLRGYLADRALAERRLDEAEKLYLTIDQLRPNSPLVLNNLAWMAGQRKAPEAVALAERALSLAPDNPAVLDTLGVLQTESGQVEKGLENMRRAVSLAPNASPLRMNLARAYVTFGRKDDARKEIDALLEKLPADSPQRAEVSALKEKL